MATHAPELSAGPVDDTRLANVLVYASNPVTRARVISAIGDRPTAGLRLTYLEVGKGDEVVAALDKGGIDLCILDGEATPTGGMGLSRQMRDEIDNVPPVLLLVGRRDDAWLATWSRAEAVVPHPLDAVELITVATGLLNGTVAQQH